MNATLTGNLGGDPEASRTQSGKALLRMSVAVKDHKGETEWVAVNVWGHMADALAGQMFKGDRVTVTGRPKVNQWTAKDGTTKTELVVNAEAVGWLPKRDRAEEPAATPTAATRQPMQHERAEDEDPFGED
jgi:single-strand DNA-binding protein